MTVELLKDLLLRFGVINGSRFTNKEKEAFRGSIQDLCEENDLRLNTVEHNNGIHLELGHPSRAKMILLVPYDTPAKYFLNSKEHFPLNEKKILAQVRNNLVVRGLIDIVGLALIVLFYLAFKRYDGLLNIVFILGIVASIYTTYKLRKSTGTVINMNCNSASIALSLSLLIEESNDFAVILIDGYYKDLAWLGYYDKMSNQQKHKTLLLESLANGDKLILGGEFKKTIRDFSLLGIEVVGNTYLPMKTIHLGFLKNEELVVRNCHSDDDFVIDVKKLNKIKEFIKILKGEC